jgi:REP element-mobilizing transposase RayT
MGVSLAAWLCGAFASFCSMRICFTYLVPLLMFAVIARTITHAQQESAMAGTYTKLIYHIVFSTKDREPLITPRMREDLYAYLGGIIRGQDGFIQAIGGMADHIHLVVGLKPDVSVSEIVRLVKANSSKWVNEQARASGGGRFAWQSGYGAFSVSVSQLKAVCEYVQKQEEHHR